MAKKDQVVELRRQGKEIQEIAEITGLKENTVRTYVNGVKPDPGKAKKTKKEEAVELRRRGKSVPEIVEITGLSEKTVRTYVYGIEPDLEKTVIERNKNVVPGWNKDRHGCRKCMYRTRGQAKKQDLEKTKRPGCDFICIAGQMRGCKVENCDVFKRGARYIKPKVKMA